MLRRAFVATLVVAAAPAPAQDDPAADKQVSRIAVLPPAGSCARAYKEILAKAADGAVADLDKDTFEALPVMRLEAEQMALGEDTPRCGAEACWLELCGKLGVPFLLRTECMEVDGTAYVTTRFLNVKARSLRATETLQAGKVDDVRRDAPELYAATLRAGLGVATGRSTRKESVPQTQGTLAQRKVAVLACEQPDGAARYAPDADGTGPTVAGAADWLKRTDNGLVEVPRSLATVAACDRQPGALAQIAQTSGARAVAILRARDVRVEKPEYDAIHVEFDVAVEGWVYAAGPARVGRRRVEARTHVRCPRPVLKARDCLDAYNKTVLSDLMVQWDEVSVLPMERF